MFIKVFLVVLTIGANGPSGVSVTGFQDVTRISYRVDDAMEDCNRVAQKIKKSGYIRDAFCVASNQEIEQ